MTRKAEEKFVLPTPADAFTGSQPKPRLPLMPVALVGTAAMLIGVVMRDAPTPAERAAQWAVAGVMLLAVLGGALGWMLHSSGRFAEEAKTVGRAEEALRLGQTEWASMMVTTLLSGPMLSQWHRTRALAIYVAGLVRAQRYDDVISAADALMSEGVLPEMVMNLRAAKAYALLREERLSDADRAITDLRKMGREGPPAAALGLAEQYRDLKTGNASGLLEHHPRRREAIAKYFGARVGDADAMAAWATKESGGPAEKVQSLWASAMMLRPLPLLVERYPELAGLAQTMGVQTGRAVGSQSVGNGMQAGLMHGGMA